METVSQEIFNIIKGANYDVVLFTEGGEKTLDADAATRFYVSEHDMMISVRSESNKLELVVQLGADFDINANKTLLDSFKSAVHKQMGEYTVKRFDKNIEPKDFSHQSVTEGFSKAFGSVKTSYVQLENARLIVKHSKGVNEEKRGARSRNIHSLFIENADKEQTRFPYKYMAGAKAMAMHVNNGGTFDDSKGAGIMNMCKEAMEMSQFITHVRTNKLVNEGNANVVETIKSQLKQIKETIRSLQTVRGYNNFESKEIVTNEENSVDISDKFLYNTFETVDMDSVLSTVSRIFNEREGKDTMHDKLLNDVLAVIKSGDDLKLNVDVNDPTNPNNEDPVKFSGGMGPLAKLSAMLSYIGMTTKNDILFNLLTQMSNDVHDMGTNNTMLAAKIANYLYKKGSAKTMEVAVATEESITDSVISELRKRIS
jgi:hypothetical protein|tara:strand:+ start:2017 stop:3297 length:1281 start_codon:yes stop_codon:yes gene_type:complete